MQDRRFIIKVLFGGLGDHLFHSHLPRIAKEHCGFDRVLISDQSEYRHPDYRRLIWEGNPYVDGFCDEDAPVPSFSSVPSGFNILDWIMLERGLEDGKRWHEPEIYVKTDLCPEVAGRVVYDPNYVSNVGTVEPAWVERYFKQSRLKVDVSLVPRGKALPIDTAKVEYRTRDLVDYCNVIKSAKRFVCLTSGGATLAAALGVSVTALWGPGQLAMFHHSKLHEYVNLYPVPARKRAYRWLRRSAKGAMATAGLLGP